MLMRNLRMHGMISTMLAPNWVDQALILLSCFLTIITHSPFNRGIGVIGEQPVILPNNSFEYSSACPLTTPSGRMVSIYLCPVHFDPNPFSPFTCPVHFGHYLRYLMTLQEGDFEMKHIDKVGSKTFNVAVAPFSLSTFGDSTDNIWGIPRDALPHSTWLQFLLKLINWR